MYADFESGGDLLCFLCYLCLPDDSDAILKADTVHYVRQLLKTPYPTPALFGRQRQLEDQSQQGVPRHAVLGAGRPMANRGKAGFDRVGGADVYPVFRREVIKGQQRVTVFLQQVNPLGYLASKSRWKAARAFSALALVSASQISRRRALALPCTESGNAARTLAVLCTQQR